MASPSSAESQWHWRGKRSNPRQQTNELSSYLDGSVVYGSDPTRAAALRTFEGGELAMSAGGLPPLNTAGLSNANDAHLVPDDQLFLAGDVRANENVELSAVHALWVREHNLIAQTIAQLFPSLEDEAIYQWTRQIVGAEMQVITYREFLPALLGSGALRPYRGYNPATNASIANEFSTAAFRVGHTLINDDVEFLDNDGNPVREEIELRDAFFNPATILEVGADPILKYLATDNAQEVDLKLVDGLRNFLFGPPGAGGFDLAARNIQRGRDHGLADYNTTRRSYGLPPVSSFSQITTNPELQHKLQGLYGSVNDIDLWVGGLAEDHVPGASVGRTFRRIIADQFERLRDGDRYWYERIFAGQALADLNATRLSDVIRRNSTITNLQDNVFFFDTEQPAAGATSSSAARPALTVEGLVRDAARYLMHIRGFRELDGSQNNPLRPSWGEAGSQLLRNAPARYADGVSEPAGQDRPGAREISNTVCALEEDSGEEAPRNERSMSDWIYAWGQFVDHDLDLTTTGSTAFDIPVPLGDPFFDPDSTGTQVIPLDRSNFDEGTGIKRNLHLLGNRPLHRRQALFE
ncbi:MAG TPA: peroxidase family protein, partial [Anaeromyxobacteraceae bacterium]|nr:peroxidase family protein [Anaeromyxobacteraceae bacterium]